MTTTPVLTLAAEFVREQLEQSLTVRSAADLALVLDHLLTATERWVRSLSAADRASLALSVAAVRSDRLIERLSVPGGEIVVSESHAATGFSATRTAWLVVNGSAELSDDLRTTIEQLGVRELVSIPLSDTGEFLRPVATIAGIELVSPGETAFQAVPAALAYDAFCDEYFYSITQYPGGRDATARVLSMHGLHSDQLLRDASRLRANAA